VWDLTVTDCAPGFSQSWPDGVETTKYHPTGGMNDGVEPLVLVREYHGASESTVELDQQFRLFHSLRYDPASGSYYKMHEDGTQALAVKIEDKHKFLVRTPLLRQYIAARQLDLLLFIDSVVWSDQPADQAEDETYKTDRYIGGLYYGDSAMTNHRYFTRYLGTKIIAPGPVETCGIWPFEEKDTNFGIHHRGRRVRQARDVHVRPRPARQLLRCQPGRSPLPHAGALPQRRTPEVLRQTRALLGRGRPPLVCPTLECPD
jgi:hypothetical protein